MEIFHEQANSATFGAQHTKRSKKREAKKRRYVARHTRRFQLRDDVEQDRHVTEILEFMKSQKREVTFIRDAICLMWALENGDSSLLREKFPFALKPDGAGGLDEIKGLLEMIVSQQKANSSYQMASLPDTKPSASGLKAIAAPKFALPTFDDDDDLPTIVTTKVEGSNWADNFLKGMMSLQQ